MRKNYSFMSKMTGIVLAAGMMFCLTSCGDNLGELDHPTSTALTPSNSELTDLSPDVAEAVDLGVVVDGKPVLFANMNVGAQAVTDYGTYFAWGETSGFTVVGHSDTPAEGNTKTSFADISTYKWYTSTTKLIKYNNDSGLGDVDGLHSLQADDDAATANWGTAWRMPTKEELNALIEQTTNEPVTNYENTGVNGYKFINKSDDTKFIFVPAGGLYTSTFGYQNTFGYYWSSSLNKSNTYYAWSLCFSKSGVGNISMAELENYRYFGLPIRAVQSN